MSNKYEDTVPDGIIDQACAASEKARDEAEEVYIQARDKSEAYVEYVRTKAVYTDAACLLYVKAKEGAYAVYVKARADTEEYLKVKKAKAAYAQAEALFDKLQGNPLTEEKKRDDD